MCFRSVLWCHAKFGLDFSGDQISQDTGMDRRDIVQLPVRILLASVFRTPTLYVCSWGWRWSRCRPPGKWWYVACWARGSRRCSWWSVSHPLRKSSLHPSFHSAGSGELGRLEIPPKTSNKVNLTIENDAHFGAQYICDTGDLKNNKIIFFSCNGLFRDFYNSHNHRPVFRD